MAAPEGKTKQSLTRATIATVAVMIVSGVGIIFFNRPGTQKFTVSATCTSVRLPNGFPVYLGHEYQSIRLLGFTGTIEHVETASAGGVPQRYPNGVLNLVAQTANPTDAPPALTLTAEKLGGALSVDARDYLQLGTEGQSLELRFGPGSEVKLSAGSLKLAASRYQNTLPETIANSIATVDGKFQVPAGESRGAMHTTWSAATGSVAISGPGGVPVSGDAGNISAYGCTDDFIQVSGSDNPVQNKRDSANVVIEANNYQFEKIAMQLPSAAPRAFIQFKVSGQGTSIMEDGREVMPSPLRQILDGKPYQLGLFGTLMIFVIFAGGTVLKRALDVFAKRLIPD